MARGSTIITLPVAVKINGEWREIGTVEVPVSIGVPSPVAPISPVPTWNPNIVYCGKFDSNVDTARRLEALL